MTSLAYYQNPKFTSYRDATIGFGFIVLGGILSPVYRFLIRSDYHLNSGQRLLLQSGGNILVAIGLGLVFYTITRHDIRSSSADDSEPLETRLSEFDEQQYDN